MKIKLKSLFIDRKYSIAIFFLINIIPAFINIHSVEANTNTSQVSIELNIKRHIEFLSGIESRMYLDRGNKIAAEYITKELSILGYEPKYDYFTWKGSNYYNIIAEAVDSSKPFILIGAHFDSTTNGNKIAPGADDNASGVALVLVVAKLVKQCNCNLNIEFAFFNLEEEGRIGSINLAKKYKRSGVPLEYFINIDTIGTWAGNIDKNTPLNYVADKNSKSVVKELEKSFNIPLKPANTLWRDDHASFWDLGYMAIELTENGVTPHMHKITDTSEKLHYPNIALVTENVYNHLLTRVK